MIKLYQAPNKTLHAYIPLDDKDYLTIVFTETYCIIQPVNKGYIDKHMDLEQVSWSLLKSEAARDAIRKILEKFLSEDNEWQNMQMLLEVQLSTTMRQYNIKKWNDEQKKLWLKVVDKLKIDKNNVQMFLKFGQEFYDYVNRNDETPTVKQMIGALK